MSFDRIGCAQRVLDDEIEGLKQTRDGLGKDFVQSVSLLLKTLSDGGRIVVTGIGKNLHIAEKISATLSS
ncbi:MAG: KpsF/GutQ family sugar-phosphate isomerase, partial [Kiritimatiellia bacterium]